MDWVVIYLITGLLVIPIFIYGVFCQIQVNNIFEKYNNRIASSGITGALLTHKLLSLSNITNVGIVEINGRLTDHYNSKYKVIKLSHATYNSPSIAALGVCAHEVGHAIQDHNKNFLFRLRTAIAPIISFITGAFVPVIFIGSLLSFSFMFTSVGYYIILISMIVYGASLVFSMITLPLEYDASKKALKLLKETGTLTSQEVEIAKEVLTAAIKTYITEFLSTLIYFLRFLSLVALSRRD